MQKLAIANDAQSDKNLTEKVLEAQHISVRLPIIRRAIEDTDVMDVKDKDKRLFVVKKDQIVICDIVRTSVLFTMPSELTKPTTELGKAKVPGSFQRR